MSLKIIQNDILKKLNRNLIISFEESDHIWLPKLYKNAIYYFSNMKLFA